MDERMQGGNHNQQVPPAYIPWSTGEDSIQGQGQQQQQVRIHYPAPHLNPNFYIQSNFHPLQHQHHPNHHHPQQQQQQSQIGMGTPSAFVRVGGGGGGWQPMYYPPPTHGHGFNGYHHVPVQNYAAGLPPGLYANPFAVNGNPPVTAPTSYVPLPTYPNPFQTLPPPLQFQPQPFPSSSNLPADPRPVHSGEINMQQFSGPSATSSPKPKIWSPMVPQQAGFHTLSSYEGQSAQTSPALPKPSATGAIPKKVRLERGSPSEPRIPKAEPQKNPRVRAKILIGRRRGGSRVLPTGLIKRTKEPVKGDSGPETTWSRYMIEVEQYRRQTCSDEKQVRPLVK